MMLRGFRWQLMAFILAVVVFAATLMTRPTQVVDVEPSPTARLLETQTPAQTAAITAATAPAQQASAVPTTEGALQQLVPPVDDVDVVPTFREALIGSVNRLNPLLAGLNPVDADITALIFEGLMRPNEYGEPEPALASGPPLISFDKLEYVVSLRQDVVWQDGTPFSADDVMYTMSVLAAPDFPGDPALGGFWRTVEVEKLDAFTVRFRLAQPLGSFAEALHIGILPAHALSGTTAAQLASHPFNLTPIGTGPYQLEALRGSAGQVTMVDLRVAPNYRLRPEGQTGYMIDRFRFVLFDTLDAVQAAMQRGEIDGYAGRQRSERLALLALDSAFITHTQIEPTIGFLIFNWASETQPAFRDMRVREALEIGLDRASIIDRHLFNQALLADSPLLQGSWAYYPNLTWPPYNISAARDLLARADLASVADEASEATAEATAEAAQDNFVLSFGIITPDDPALVNAAQEIATQWSQLNLNVQVEAVDLNTYRTRLETGQFDTALVELSKFGSADPDVYNFWHQGQYPDGDNYGGANDRVISELLERGRSDPNGSNRILYYREFQRQFVTRAVALPLYYPLYTYFVSEQVEGVQLGFIAAPSDRFRTIRDWRLRG